MFVCEIMSCLYDCVCVCVCVCEWIAPHTDTHTEIDTSCASVTVVARLDVPACINITIAGSFECSFCTWAVLGHSLAIGVSWKSRAGHFRYFLMFNNKK